MSLPGEVHTWYCWETEGRGCWGAAESAALEDGAGGRETGCFGWRGPGAELPPTESEDGQWSPMRSGLREKGNLSQRESVSENSPIPQW